MAPEWPKLAAPGYNYKRRRTPRLRGRVRPGTSSGVFPNAPTPRTPPSNTFRRGANRILTRQKTQHAMSNLRRLAGPVVQSDPSCMVAAPVRLAWLLLHLPRNVLRQDAIHGAMPSICISSEPKATVAALLLLLWRLLLLSGPPPSKHLGLRMHPPCRRCCLWPWTAWMA